MKFRRLILTTALVAAFPMTAVSAEESQGESAISRQMEQRKQQALAPSHRKVLQRKSSSEDRFRKSDMYRYTAPDGAVTLTNIPDKYQHKRGYLEEELKFKPINPSAKFAKRAPAPTPVAPRRSAYSGISQYTKEEYGEIIREAATTYGVDEDLIYAVIRCESGFNPTAVSRAGACGLMQLMPGTAAEMGITGEAIYDPAMNIHGGTQYLAKMLQIFGDTQLALAAYNAGPQRVHEYKGVPPFAETKAYVRNVVDRWARIKGGTVTRDQLLAEANSSIKRGIRVPTAPVATAKQFMVHFHSGLVQPADSVSDKDPYYEIEYNKRLYTVRKDLVARIAEPA